MNLIRVNEEALRGHSFREKFNVTFRQLIIMAAVAVVSLAVTVFAALCRNFGVNV